MSQVFPDSVALCPWYQEGHFLGVVSQVKRKLHRLETDSGHI